jgi:rSAM-associated Gly-rich repeat protein
MKITTPLSWTAFLLTLAAWNGTAMAAMESSGIATSEIHPVSLEDRLTRIAEVLKMKEEQRPNPYPPELAGGWGNGRGGGGGFVNTRGPGWGNVSGGGGFVNTRGPGWGNVSGGGGFVNASPFRNGWSDGGSFLNRR